MKRKKYADGTGAGGVGGGQDYSSMVQGGTQLLGEVFNLMKTLGDRGAYSSQPVVTQRQTASYNPYSKDFGNTNLPQFAMGGVAGSVPINVEDEEVLETPDGSVAQVNGSTHAQGGENMTVPHGTKIFSDRIKIGDKTMAERKAAREKTEARLKRLAAKNPIDQLLKNTLKRTLEVNAMEEAQDMEIQMMAQQATQGARQKFAVGGVAGIDWENINKMLGGTDVNLNPQTDLMADTNGGTMKGIDLGTTLGGETTAQQVPMFNWGFNDTYQNVAPSNPATPVAPTVKDTTKSASGYTLGDGIGMAGNVFGAFAPLFNTMANRAGDTPNRNTFKNFGKDALSANEDAQGYVRGQRENAEEDLRTSRNASKIVNRDGARGINTIRALDLATDLGYNKGTNQLYDTFAKQMMTMLGQKSELENVQDTYVMTGEAKRDQADRADRDNFYANRGADFANLGTNVQAIGKNLNTSQGNDDMVGLMAQLSKYGLGYVRDKKGNLVLQKIKE